MAAPSFWRQIGRWWAIPTAACIIVGATDSGEYGWDRSRGSGRCKDGSPHIRAAAGEADATVWRLRAPAACAAHGFDPQLGTWVRPKGLTAFSVTGYTTVDIEGWSVLLNNEMLDVNRRELLQDVLKALQLQLFQIKKRLPPPAVQRLLAVPIWVELNQDGSKAPPLAAVVYHRSPEWVAAHGLHSGKARAIEITDAAKFLLWWQSQPCILMHELSHAYHDRVLSFENPDIIAAFQTVVQERRYESVMRNTPNGAPMVRSYALENELEYFAKATESYFCVSDFFPFVRAELHAHDTKTEELIKTLWQGDQRSSN